MRLLCILSFFAIVSCSLIKKWHKPIGILKRIPKDFPEMIIPEGNEITGARVALGKKLFFDKLKTKSFIKSMGFNVVL